ncbi:MAG: NAD-dependent epimerase/dehydratase family protein [Salinivirgaceae bacterium]|jgi:nucleoside-diphosphate-sugar epimerase|nr:NAD-dependent epimerase/dehydratase family protein [Salinivirgaceae bacterium]
MITILATCVGSGVGQSILDSLNLTNRYRTIGVDMNQDVYAYAFCDKLYPAPNIYSEEYLPFIIDVCKKENVDVLIPGHDHELGIFSKNIELLHQHGINVIVSGKDIIEISRDKFAWFKYFEKLGCSIVPTLSVKDFKRKPDSSFFPAIIKPIGGSASQGVHIVHNMDELLQEKDEDIIQPYLFPEKNDPNLKAVTAAGQDNCFFQLSEISIQLIFSKQSELQGIFISKNTLKAGIPIFVDPIQANEFPYIDEIYKFAAVLKSKQVIGPVNLQGRITDHGFFFFEMNMRFTGITGTRARLGFNEVAYLVDHFAGKNAELTTHAKNKVGIRQVACATKVRKGTIKAKKTCAILGASGFIGSAFTRQLLEKAEYQQVFLVCRDQSYQKYCNIFSINDKIKVIPESDQTVESIYAQTDVLINFTGSRANKPDVEMYEALDFQFRQSQKIAEAGTPLIIIISSHSDYNQKEDSPKTETHDLSIENSYAFQKYMGEQFFHSAHERYSSTKVISLRFTRVIGVPQNGTPEGFFTHLIKLLKDDKPVEIPFPENKINLFDIQDAVGSIFHFMDYAEPDKLPSIINVGGTNLSIGQYAKTVIDTLNWKEKQDLLHIAQTTEVQTSSQITSDLARQYEWKNRFTIEDTIKSIYKFLQNNN